ncbi:MAG: hypothetical protein AAGB04_16610 [Pseudomonadota bacterium]
MAFKQLFSSVVGRQSSFDLGVRAPSRAAEIAAEHCNLNIRTNEALDLFAAHVDQPPKKGSPEDWREWLNDVEAFGATAKNLATRLGNYDKNEDILTARIVDIEAGLFQARVLASRARD